MLLIVCGALGANPIALTIWMQLRIKDNRWRLSAVRGISPTLAQMMVPALSSGMKIEYILLVSGVGAGEFTILVEVGRVTAAADGVAGFEKAASSDVAG